MGHVEDVRVRFAALFAEMSPRVFAYARRHCDLATAQDVVSETFLVAWRRCADIPPHALPWLLVVARNVMANRRRGEHRRDRLTTTLTRLAQVAAPEPGAEDTVIERAVLLAALADLTDLEREALLLTAWDGLSHREAARVAGCSVHAFEVRLSRARARPSHHRSPAGPRQDRPHRRFGNHMTSIHDDLTRYAPTPDSIGSEWTAARQDAVLAAIIGEHSAPSGPSVEIPIRPRFTPPRRRRRTRLVALSGAALTATACVVLALVLPGGPPQPRPQQPAAAGPVIDPPSGLSDTALPAGTYSYRVVQQIQLDDTGKPVPSAPDAMIDRSYVNTAGDIISFRTGSQHGCFRFPNPGAGLDAPSVAVLTQLPTDVAPLERYLRAHVNGSSSRDQAVFVAVGDALGTADGLASPRLRAALLGVLSRTPGVYLHFDQHDYLGRPAIRADFVNQKIRPGEVQSLYFDPATFQLLEQRTSANGQPTTYAGPSPAYTAPAAQADSPDTLPAAGFIQVMTHERVVTSLPKIPDNCH